MMIASICLHGLVSVKFSALYLISKVSEKKGVGPPLSKRHMSWRYFIHHWIQRRPRAQKAPSFPNVLNWSKEQIGRLWMIAVMYGITLRDHFLLSMVKFDILSNPSLTLGSTKDKHTLTDSCMIPKLSRE